MKADKKKSQSYFTPKIQRKKICIMTIMLSLLLLFSILFYMIFFMTYKHMIFTSQITVMHYGNILQ